MINSISGERALIVPDIHCPFQDNRAIGAVLEFAKYFKPNAIIFLGDLFDCKGLSRFLKEPGDEDRFQQEIDVGIELLGSFRRIAPKAIIKYLKGNHEDRLRKFLFTQGRALASLRSLKWPNLLELDSLKIDWVESGHLMFHGILIKHGNIVRQHSGYSAKAEMDKNGISGISGHTHRLGKFYHNSFGGYKTWIEAGCLCRLDSIDWLEGQTPNWHQGIAVGFFKKGSGRFSASDLPIVNGKLLYDMKEFSGR